MSTCLSRHSCLSMGCVQVRFGQNVWLLVSFCWLFVFLSSFNFCGARHKKKLYCKIRSPSCRPYFSTWAMGCFVQVFVQCIGLWGMLKEPRYTFMATVSKNLLCFPAQKKKRRQRTEYWTFELRTASEPTFVNRVTFHTNFHHSDRFLSYETKIYQKVSELLWIIKLLKIWRRCIIIFLTLLLH